jgi:Putative beta-barrel porin-2, OmpL-like. bbp2
MSHSFSEVGVAGTVSRVIRHAEIVVLLMMIVFPCLLPLRAQTGTASTDAPRTAVTTEGLQGRVVELEGEVAELKRIVKELQSNSQPASGSQSPPTAQPTSSAQTQSASVDPSTLTPRDRASLDFLRDTTINVGLDGYYAFNFNSPIGRVNLLRAYDVLSNSFSLNQASVIFERPPDVADGRRLGGRLDLQFGQATDTLQGNPLNEPRPDIYRNVFQAYGTYVVPVGRGLNLDFGKWASSLGFENNYTKDQMNYSRSFWFDFLPFYHMGFRTSYPVNDHLSVNYWLVNGTNQVEPTNGFKDELFGFTATPRKTITWTMNYYLGQEHPDRISVPATSPIPVQPGLSFAPIIPAPNGRLNIFDSYVSWQTTPKLALGIEGDYVIERLWRNSAPGESSAPSHVDGGAAYLKYQLTPKFTLAGRAEYLSDRGGLFSGLTQALKETTATFDYNVADGFLMRYEWRRDFSNQPSFLTDTQGLLSKQQNTATLGLVWWWGRKEGAW